MFSTTYVYDRGTQFEGMITIAERPNGTFVYVHTKDAGCEIVSSKVMTAHEAREAVDALAEKTDPYCCGFLEGGKLMSYPTRDDAEIPEYA